MARSSLPPGFRFHPTDVELIMYYLKKKLLGKKLSSEISELNIYKFSPWDLPDKSCMRSKDLEWFFFCPREKKYASGARTNRATESGYWKTTGKDRSVYYKDKVVGMIKTLVFHTGHAPNGERTDWVMHEYRFLDSDLANAGVSQDAYVLCKVFQKSGPGPKNGAQYGAPFNEEEWENDEVIAADSSAVHGLSPAAIVPFNNQNISPLTSMAAPQSACSWSLTEPGPSTALPTANGAHADVPGDDEIASLLDMFTEEPFLPTRSNNNEEFNNHYPGYVVEAVPCSDGNDIYTGLGDLAYSASLSESGFNISNIMEDNFALNPMFRGGAFLELSDLETPIEFPAEAQLEQLPPIYITSSNIAVNSGNLDHGRNFNFLGTSQYPSPLNQPPAVPEGSLWGNGCNMLQQENGVQAAASQGHSYPLYHMDLASTGEREESSNIAAQSQIRGKQQRICYSRKLQQLLEPIPSHPASEVDQHFAAMCGRAHDNISILSGCDSSDVKAEVTPGCGCGCGWCTKDALSMKLGESLSTSMSSCRCSLLYHGADLQGDVAGTGCSNGFASTIFLGLTTLVFSVVLIMKLEQTMCSNLRNTCLSYLSKYLLLFNDWSFFIDSFLHRFLRIGFVLWNPQSQILKCISNQAVHKCLLESGGQSAL